MLAMVDIDGFDSFVEKFGEPNVINKMNQIGNIISSFCQNNPRKLKGFKCNDIQFDDQNKHDIFAMLMYCHPKLSVAEKYVAKLIKKINNLSNVRVSVGIAKMNTWETFEQWKKRAITNLQKVLPFFLCAVFLVLFFIQLNIVVSFSFLLFIFR